MQQYVASQPFFVAGQALLARRILNPGSSSSINFRNLRSFRYDCWYASFHSRDPRGRTRFSFVDELALTTGIVTVVDTIGFYLQDPTGDGDIATADGIFVFTGFDGPPPVSVGDEISVEGTVSEFIPGGADTNNLSTTQISGDLITVISSGNALPAPDNFGDWRSRRTRCSRHQ